MKVNFKFLTFCLIAMLLVVSYRKTINARNTRPTANYAIKQGRISFPKAGTYKLGSLFALINGLDRNLKNEVVFSDTNYPNLNSTFIITDKDGKNSYSAKNVGFDKAWAKANANKDVRLTSDPAHVNNLKARGVLPSNLLLNDLNKLIRGQMLPKNSPLSGLNYNKNNRNAAAYVNQYTNAYNLLKHIADNFSKITLYFEAVSPIANPKDGKFHTYKLYIADPCPGATNWMMIIQGRLNPQLNIPAYTNVLSRWNVN